MINVTKYEKRKSNAKKTNNKLPSDNTYLVEFLIIR